MWSRVLGPVVHEISLDRNAFKLVGEGSIIFQNIGSHSASDTASHLAGPRSSKAES